MKGEILTAKRILKDPNLSKYATRKFNGTVDKHKPVKFLMDGAQITEMIEKEMAKKENYEIELLQKENPKLYPGVEVLTNADVPINDITRVNMFKKLNFTQFTPDTI